MRNNHASVARRAHRAQRPRPTQLVAPKLHEASFRACVLDDPARNCDAHSDPADGFADRVVVREVLEKRVEATDSLQRFAAHRDRRTEARPCQAQRKANQHIGQEVVIDRHAGKPRPEAGHGRAAIQAGDQPDARLCECRDCPREIIAFDRNVAVRQHHDLVPDTALQSDQRGNLRIRSSRMCRYQQLQIRARSFGDQAIDNRNSRIVRVLHPEQDLHRAGIILIAKRCQFVVQAEFGAVQRLEDGDARERGGLARVFACESAHRHGRDQGIDATRGRQDEKAGYEPGCDCVKHERSASGLSQVTSVH